MRLCALCAYSTLIDVRPSGVLPLWRSAAPPSTCRERPLWRSARLLHAQPVANLRPWTFDFGPWSLQAFALLRTPQFTHSFTNCQASHNILYVHPPPPTTGCGRGPNERQSPHQPCAICLCALDAAPPGSCFQPGALCHGRHQRERQTTSKEPARHVLPAQQLGIIPAKHEVLACCKKKSPKWCGSPLSRGALRICV
jgi:hypothetical protein